MSAMQYRFIVRRIYKYAVQEWAGENRIAVYSSGNTRARTMLAVVSVKNGSHTTKAELEVWKRAAEYVEKMIA